MAVDRTGVRGVTAAAAATKRRGRRRAGKGPSYGKASPPAAGRPPRGRAGEAPARRSAPDPAELLRRRAGSNPNEAVDPDIARRRSQVAEQKARSLLLRSLMILAALGAAGLIAWLLNSPYLSIEEVMVKGASNAAVEEVLARHQVVEGRPLAAIRVGSVEEGLAADPWVVSASVRLVFPTRIEVYVQERAPVAWMPLEGRWALLADDGVIVDYADAPRPDGSVIHIAVEDPGLGGEVENEDVFGALRFLEALPDDLAAQSAVHMIGEEIWVNAANRPVRLGTPIEMASKAESLHAVIGIAPDGVIDVTAPGRPAVSPWKAVKPLEKRALYLQLQLEL